MEISIYEYIFILLNIVIVFAILYYFVWLRITEEKENEPFIEGIKIKMPKPIPDINIPEPPSLKQIGDTLSGPFKDAGNKFTEAGDKMKNGANDVINKVKNDVLGPLEDIFKKAKQAFEVIPDRFKKFGKAFDKIFKGIGEEVEGVFDGVWSGFVNISVFIQYLGIFLFMYIECGVKMIENLHKCIFYYALQAVGQIFYLPFRIILWFFKQIGADFYSLEKTIWDNVEWIDGNIFRYLGFHITHYTRSVRDQCYNCKRLKQSTIKNKATDIDNDFRYGIRDKLNKGIKTLTEAGNDFKSVFK